MITILSNQATYIGIIKFTTVYGCRRAHHFDCGKLFTRTIVKDTPSSEWNGNNRGDYCDPARCLSLIGLIGQFQISKIGSVPRRADLYQNHEWRARTSVATLARSWGLALKLAHCGENALPNLLAINVTLRKQFVGAMGRDDLSIIAVPLHQQMGRAPDVDFFGQERCPGPLALSRPADSARLAACPAAQPLTDAMGVTFATSNPQSPRDA